MKNKSTILILSLILSIQISFGNVISNKNNNIKSFKSTIMIDLDGVLDNYTKYDNNKIPEIKSGAKEFLENLSQDYRLILFTTRNTKQATEWLIKNKIDIYFYDVTNVKIPAKIYIDDKAINFKGNYEQTMEDIKNFNVYWK